MGQKTNLPGKKPGNALLVAVLFLIGIVGLDVFLVTASPAGDAGGVFWFVVISLFFAVLLVVAIVYGSLQKRMVQEMKAPLPAGAAREPDRPREEKGTPPPHPFEYRLFDLSTPIQPSPKAAEMFEQASTYLQRFKTNLMYSAFFIWACFLPLGAVLLVVPDVLPGSISLFCGAPLAILVAWVAVNPRKSSAESHGWRSDSLGIMALLMEKSR